MLEGNTFLLPFKERDYTSFSWFTGEGKGSFDIRIYDRTMTSGNVLAFYANIGSLEGTEHHWKALTQDIDYPVVVQDRIHGDIYANPSYERMQ